MAHNLEIKNGKASFVSARVPAWHQLGNVLEHSMTAEEALSEANLSGWNIRKAPIFALDENTGEMVQIEDRFGVIRDGGAPLGVVGNTYKIMQNEQLTGLLDALVDESGAHYETAGALDKGRKVFVSMKMPQSIKVGGVDQIENYLTAMTSHDGSTSTVVMVTPVRVVCQNTMALALANSKTQFRVRHTSSAERVILNEARKALDMTFGYMSEFQDMAEKLINTTMTQSTFEQIIDKEFGVAEDAPSGTQTRWNNKLDTMVELFAESNTHKDVRNTAWAGLNALTEWFDHFSPVRGVETSEQDIRAERVITDTKFKEKALNVISGYAFA